MNNVVVEQDVIAYYNANTITKANWSSLSASEQRQWWDRYMSRKEATAETASYAAEPNDEAQVLDYYIANGPLGACRQTWVKILNEQEREVWRKLYRSSGWIVVNGSHYSKQEVEEAVQRLRTPDPGIGAFTVPDFQLTDEDLKKASQCGKIEPVKIKKATATPTFDIAIEIPAALLDDLTAGYWHFQAANVEDAVHMLDQRYRLAIEQVFNLGKPK